MAKVSLYKCRRFPEDESGAVTVDWVALTAAVIGLALVMVMQVFSASESASNTANTTLQSAMTRAGETN